MALTFVETLEEPCVVDQDYLSAFTLKVSGTHMVLIGVVEHRVKFREQ